MKRKATIQTISGAAAVLLLFGQAPPAAAFGGHTRSANALPSAKALAQPRMSLARAPAAISRPSFAAPSVQVPRSNGLARLFSFLPSRFQTRILDLLSQRPRGGLICTLLGAPGCTPNDSFG